MNTFTSAPKLSNYQVALALASRLENLGLVPFKSQRERFLITLPGDDPDKELIELGRALKGGRYFRPNCVTKDQRLIEEFSAFCSTAGLENCYYWSICLPIRKASFENLEGALNNFNGQINTQFSELRKQYGFEQLVLALHIRYDDLTDRIDLHAHFVCRVPPQNLEHVRNFLLRKFSRPDVNVKPIENAEAVLNVPIRRRPRGL